jgi:hypothetical protein
VCLGLAENLSIPDDRGSERDRSDLGATIMADHIIDLALPAHNPNIPKPRGLLAIPPEVAKQVAATEARLEREKGIRISPDERKRWLDRGTLSWYYDDAYIAYRHTPEVVEVLAVGHDEVNQNLKEHPLETRRDVVIGVFW